MPGYYHIPRYFDLYQTSLNYFHIILGTCAPNPAACFCCSHRTCTLSRARGAGSRAGGEQTRPAIPRATSPPLSAGQRHGLSPGAAVAPSLPALRRGAEGRQARHPGTLIFFRPRARVPTPASIKLGYIKQTNRRHLPIITPDTSPDKRRCQGLR